MKNGFIYNLLRLSDIKEKGDVKRLILRYIASALGVIIIGIGCGAVVEMAVGCDTYTCFNRSIWYILTEKLGDFPFGHINLSVNIVLFVFMLILRRDLIGFGTLFNMVAVGYIIDLMHYLFGVFGITGNELNYFLRVFIIVAALPVIAFGDALYIKASLGISPFDGIPFILSKLTGGKYSFRILRTLTDCFCLAGGFLLGLITGKQFELANAGTVILALGTGTLIAFFGRFIDFGVKTENKSDNL